MWIFYSQKERNLISTTIRKKEVANLYMKMYRLALEKSVWKKVWNIQMGLVREKMWFVRELKSL